MKKIGVISDVHGNLQALQVALEHLKNEGCEEIIHTGDVVDIGANSAECLQLLLANGVVCLMGNHDRDFVENNAVHKVGSHVSARHKKHVFAQVEPMRQEIEKFPMFATRILGGKIVVFEHYCRLQKSTDGNVFAPLANRPTVEIFDEMYADYNCDAVFFGHKHEPCDFVGKKLYVDVGSVGCHPQSTASGIIISYDDTHFDYERFALPYDAEQTHKAMQEVPDGEYLFDFYFLHKKNLPENF